MVNICIQMELNMKAIGKQIYSMEKEQKHGQMDLYFLDNTEKVKRMVQENINGQMVHAMKDNGQKMRFKDLVIINGQI